ncbi:MAG: DNA mismatch repair protein MutS [Clostridiaceae bacterium]
MDRALKHYTLKSTELQEKNDSLSKESTYYSTLRLIIFIGGLAVTYIAYRSGNTSFMYIAILLFMGLFLIAAYKHGRVIEELVYIKAMIEVVAKGKERLEENFDGFLDKGESFIDKSHPYTYDLDIFGEGSLYQRYNGTSTYLGRERLASELQGEISFNKEEILKRQQAIEELAGKADFREDIEVVGVMEKGERTSPSELIAWKGEREKLFSSSIFKVIIWGLNLLTAVIVVMMILGIVDYRILLLDIILNGLVLLWGKNKRVQALKLIELYKENINTYFKIVELTEKEPFTSPLLLDLKERLQQGEKSASYQLKELAKIVRSLSDTHNAYYLIINHLTLMDYHILMRLEEWKNNYGGALERWLEVAAEMEALCSLSIINFENEDYSIPEIVDYKVIEGKSIGHPLLGQKAVTNDFSLKEPHSAVLITGSNMSGKSTFLRTLGINLLLSYLGTRVRAEAFTCGIMNIYTCMRVNDDLKESISSFYAELLRIEEIIKATKEDKPIFYLLDEIFKGTNSMDRHKGAEILLKQLMKRNTLGLVSTHDLELTDMENTHKGVINYHFKEYYEDNKLKFDYKLRRGYSTTQNALYLMRMIGIEEE